MKMRFNAKEEGRDAFSLFDFVQIAEVIKMNGGSPKDATVRVFTSFRGLPQTVEVEFEPIISRRPSNPQEN
jgi:hypothetical protein